jgi:hypothetical protein
MPCTTNHFYYLAHGPTIGLGNYLKGFVTMLSIAESPEQMKIVSSDDMNCDYHNILDACHVIRACDLSPKYARFFNCGLMVLADETDQLNIPNEYNTHHFEFVPPHLRHLFGCKASIDLCYDPSLISPRVYDRIMDVLRRRLRLKASIVREADEFMAGKDNALGVSVRSWTAPHEHGVHRPYDRNVYLDKLVQTLRQFPDIRDVVISCDNDQEVAVYEDFLRMHFPSVELHTTKARSELTYLQHGMVKMLILSRCKYFICNRISTFSEMVFWYSGMKQRIFPLF